MDDLVLVLVEQEARLENPGYQKYIEFLTLSLSIVAFFTRMRTRGSSSSAGGRPRSSTRQGTRPSSSTTRSFLLLVFFLLASPLLPILAVSENDDDDEFFPETCGLYMAKSSIPNAGWGVYTGRDLQKDEIIQPKDVAINVVDYDENAKNRIKRWLMHDYYWVSERGSLAPRCLFEPGLKPHFLAPARQCHGIRIRSLSGQFHHSWVWNAGQLSLGSHQH